MKAYNGNVIGNIHSIETLGAFDGPGLRYVLFMQGCPFRCKYCHNRDTWSITANKQMTVEDVLRDYEKYSPFYSKGGMTVSGGEPTLQIDFVTELFREAKNRNIHTALDTSAACYSSMQKDKYVELLKYTDLVLLDIKQANSDKHKDLTGFTNEQVIEFAKLLNEKKIKTIIRHVLIPKITDDKESLKSLRKLLNSLHNVIGIEILPYHKKGIEKWKQMGLEYPLEKTPVPSKESIRNAERILKDGYHFYE